MTRRALQVGVLLAAVLLLADLRLPSLWKHWPWPASYAESGGVARVEGVIASELFVSRDSLPFASPSSQLLGGHLDQIQRMSAPAFLMLPALASTIGVIGVCGVLLFQGRSRRWSAVIAIAGFATASMMVSLRVSTGWDEFYLNLRHSQNLMLHGSYSLNAFERVEATVDLLPLAAAGMVSRVSGHSPDDLLLLMGLLGTLLLLSAASAFVWRVTRSLTTGILVGAWIATLPPVLHIGATGFTATLFSGLLLWTLYAFLELRGPWSFRAYVNLGLLPLVRIESLAVGAGTWCGVVVRSVWRHRRDRRGFHHWLRRSGRILGWRGIAVFLPFLAMSAIRALVFGFPIPLPVLHKAAEGDLAYLRAGIMQFHDVTEILGLGPVILLAALLLPGFFGSRGWRYTVAFAALGLMSCGYVMGGGDWFPASWARYWLPMLAFTLVCIACALHLVLRVSGRVSRTFAVGGLILVATALGYEAPRSAARAIVTRAAAGGSGWGRVDSLASLGRLLSLTTDSTWRIASSEVATIMYFARRDVVGLLGVENPDIALAPIAPLEPGNRFHRRRNPATLEHRLPEVIAFGEAAFRSGALQDVDDIQAAVRENLYDNRRQMVDFAYYRAGSYDWLQALGYQSVTVHAGPDLFTYWVRDSVLERHRALLRARGFQAGGVIHIPYHVSSSVSRRFRPTSAAWSAFYARRRPAAETIVTHGAARLAGALPSGVDRVHDAYYSTADFGGAAIGKVRMRLSRGFGQHELRLPLLLGEQPGGVSVRLLDSASGSTIAEIPVPRRLGAQWLTFRVRVPTTQSPVDLVVSDTGRTRGQWFSVGAPWWMGPPAKRPR